MIARVTTWLFYAVVFFFLGVWASPHVPSVRETMNKGWESAKLWAQGTIATPTMRGETVAPAPTATPTQPATVARARAAFAAGDVNRAVAIYRERIRETPSDLDAMGELGNVFLTSGRLQEAAQAFYDVGVALVKRGDLARAQAMTPIVRRGNGALADDLERQIAQGRHSPGPRG